MKIGRALTDKTSCLAWSPGLESPPLLALGSLAGAMDASFSSLSELELYALSLNGSSQQTLVKQSAVPVNSKFNALVWSPFYGKKGLLAGGKENGELDFYDPSQVLKGVKEPLLRQSSLFNGPVKGLDYSPVSPHLFAAGGPDAEVSALIFFHWGPSVRQRVCERVLSIPSSLS